MTNGDYFPDTPAESEASSELRAVDYEAVIAELAAAVGTGMADTRRSLQEYAEFVERTKDVPAAQSPEAQRSLGFKLGGLTSERDALAGVAAILMSHGLMDMPDAQAGVRTDPEAGDASATPQ